MKYGLQDQHLRLLSEIIKKYPSVTHILLFGSRALGTHKRASDIDIALKGDIPLWLIARLKDELEESTLPYTCDILSYERAPKELKEHIDQNAILLYSSQ